MEVVKRAGGINGKETADTQCVLEWGPFGHFCGLSGPCSTLFQTWSLRPNGLVELCFHSVCIIYV